MKRLKICDLTQFYSPLSGGVKRYVHEKIAYIQKYTPTDEHILVIPGAKTETVSNDAVADLFDPFAVALAHVALSRVAESARDRGDPGAGAAGHHRIERSVSDRVEGNRLWPARSAIPVVGFYHSHFPEAYLRSAAQISRPDGDRRRDGFRPADTCAIFITSFEATLVPSENLAQLLRDWGVENVRAVDLGVNTEIFKPRRTTPGEPAQSLRCRASDQKLLLYVGRLAKEKNTADTIPEPSNCCARAIRAISICSSLATDRSGAISKNSRAANGNITWIRYCTDSADLARYYRAADLFVHPGVQETFGLVALESQACGTPVVGIRGSYMDRIIFHEQESWARENTPEALGDAIEELSTRKLTILGGEASQRVRESSIAGRRYSINYFAFIAKSAQNTRKSCT